MEINDREPMTWRRLYGFPVEEFMRRCETSHGFARYFWGPKYLEFQAYVYATNVPDMDSQALIDKHYWLASPESVERSPQEVSAVFLRFVKQFNLLIAMRTSSTEQEYRVGDWEAIRFRVLRSESVDCSIETWLVADSSNADLRQVEGVIDSPFFCNSIGFLAIPEPSFRRARPLHEFDQFSEASQELRIIGLMGLCYDDEIPVFLIDPEHAPMLA